MVPCSPCQWKNTECGIKLKYFDEVIGKIVNMDVKHGDVVTVDILSEE